MVGRPAQYPADCLSRRGDLAALALDALSRREAAALRHHLARCPTCAAEYSQLLAVRRLLNVHESMIPTSSAGIGRP